MHKLSKSFILRNLGAHIRAFSRYNPELAQLYFFFLRRIPSHTPRLYLLLSSSLFNNSAFFPVFHAFQGPFLSSPWIFASWVSNFNVSSTFSWILSFFVVSYFWWHCWNVISHRVWPEHFLFWTWSLNIPFSDSRRFDHNIHSKIYKTSF